MNLSSSQQDVRWKAVWGSKRKFVGALLLTFIGFTANAIADVVSPDELNPTFIVPSVFDPTVAPAVAAAVRPVAT